MSTLSLQPIELCLLNSSVRVDILVVDSNGDPSDATQLSLDIFTQDGNLERTDQFLPSPNTLTGTVTVTAGSTTVVGSGTLFSVELAQGDTITIGTGTHVVDYVTSDISLTLRTAHVLGAAGASVSKSSRIQKPIGTTGQYYYLYGDRTAGANTGTSGQTETNTSCDKLFQWNVVAASGTEAVSQVQTLKVVSPRIYRIVPYFRGMLDKSVKVYDTDPANPCLLGYSDSNLIQYLEQGLHIINSYQPYPTWSTLDDFPFEMFGHTLLEASMVAGILAQQLYAIDTDMPFSDQGNTFTISHAPQLAAMLNQITTRLDVTIPKMKLHFVNAGHLHVQQGPNWRLNQLIQAAPTGALFRNLWFR